MHTDASAPQTLLTGKGDLPMDSGNQTVTPHEQLAVVDVIAESKVR